MLDHKDIWKNNLIEEIINFCGFYIIKVVSKTDKEMIERLGSHKINHDAIVIYDYGAFIHFKSTFNLTNKTRRLSPIETVDIILDPESILPNFIKNKTNSYIFTKSKGGEILCIAEVLNNKIRITHGGFEVKDKNYLKKEKELQKSILEGRHSLISHKTDL